MLQSSLCCTGDQSFNAALWLQFVANGARFKLTVPKENCVISFACAAIRCPKCARRDTGAEEEPFGNEALIFARNLCLQRDIEIEVESIDKSGTFLGRR